MVVFILQFFFQAFGRSSVNINSLSQQFEIVFLDNWYRIPMSHELSNYYKNTIFSFCYLSKAAHLFNDRKKVNTGKGILGIICLISQSQLSRSCLNQEMKNTPDQNKCFVAYYKINVPKYSCNLMRYIIPTITCDTPYYIKGKSFSYVINIV